MTTGAYPVSRGDAERTIALARVALAWTSLFAVWLDPAEPARYAQLTYSLHSIYLAYSIAIMAALWLGRSSGALPFITHVADIAAFSVFQFLTLGPSSPFFIYFIFSLFCAAIRWGWGATLWTAGVVVSAYLLMTISVTHRVGPQEFEVSRAIIRTMYLLVSAGLLVYLGRHEQRLREEIERLARWPATAGLDAERATDSILGHAVEIMGARRALVVWEAGEEPALNVAAWSPAGSAFDQRPPGGLEDLVGLDLERSTFVCAGPVAAGAPLMVAATDQQRPGPQRLTLPPLIHDLQGAIGLSSAPFQTERVTGRAFFADLGTPGPEILPLTDIVAREIVATGNWQLETI